MEICVSHRANRVGRSLPVGNVQELASKNLEDIPCRYIWPKYQTDEVSIRESSQIPVINMSKLAARCDGEYQSELSKLHHASREWGFFQLIDHGATATIEKMKLATQEFFKLPLEQKMIYAQRPGSLEGYGQAFVMTEDQKLDWNDMLFIYSVPESARDLSFWPKIPASFRSSLEEYSLQLHKICTSLCKLMAANLGVEFKKFAGMYEDELLQSIRMNYCPPCTQADKVIGASPHSDLGSSQ